MRCPQSHVSPFSRYVVVYYDPMLNKVYQCNVLTELLISKKIFAIEQQTNIVSYCIVRCAILLVWVGGIPWPKISPTQYHALRRLPNKVLQSKGWLFSIIGI